jgi:hypothetical protein
MIKHITLLLCLFYSAVTSAATFVNLDFEAYSGTGTDLFPGWGVTGTLFPQVDLIPLGTAGVSLISTTFGAIEGQYSALLNAANGENIGISQTAMVPLNATHISFVTSDLFLPGVTYSYTLGGIDLLSETTEDLGNGLTKYTTAIQSFAGQTVSMGFFAEHSGDFVQFHRLDDIQFTVVPVPAAVYLFVSGLAGLMGFARSKYIFIPT